MYEVVKVGERGAIHVEKLCGLESCNKPFVTRQDTLNTPERKYCSLDCYRLSRGAKRVRKAFTCIDCGEFVSQTDRVDFFRTARVCSSCEKKRAVNRVNAKKLRRKLFIKRWRKEILNDED